MPRPVTRPGALKKPSTSSDVKARKNLHVKYIEPRPWRSEASHRAYQEYRLWKISEGLEHEKSRYGTACGKQSPNKLQRMRDVPARLRDLDYAVARLVQFKNSHSATLQGMRAGLGDAERRFATKDPELCHAARSVFSRKAKPEVLQWCRKINAARTEFMGRWQPISKTEMDIFANAKMVAESYFLIL